MYEGPVKYYAIDISIITRFLFNCDSYRASYTVKYEKFRKS